MADYAGLQGIVGFGSLLSEKSARASFPSLTGFRTCRIEGYRRVFAHTSAVFFERGIARPETGEIGGLSVEKREGPAPEGEPPLLASLFFIPADEVPAFYKRELEYCITEISPLDAVTGEEIGCTALVCERSSDAHFLEHVCKGSQERWEEINGRWGIAQIWDRTDVLPTRCYLRHCVLAAKKLGAEVHDSFLRATYLCDRKTTIEQHLKNDPTVLDELPTPAAAPYYMGE